MKLEAILMEKKGNYSAQFIESFLQFNARLKFLCYSHPHLKALIMINK